MSVFVVFPEPVEQLQSFADQFDIAVPLLADPDSRVIREFGILNTTLTPDDEPFYGIPYPGSYVVGTDGRVVAKYFEQNSLVRVDPNMLLRAALGQSTSLDHAAIADTTAASQTETVELDVSFSGDYLRSFLPRDLVVTLRVPVGQHLYGPPVSDGLVVTSVEVDENRHIAAQQAQLPATHPMTLAGTGETLHVYDGTVTIRVPLVYNGAPAKPDAQGDTTVELTGTVRWQACDDHACFIPRTETFAVAIALGAPNVPGRLSRDSAGDS